LKKCHEKWEKLNENFGGGSEKVIGNGQWGLCDFERERGSEKVIGNGQGGSDFFKAASMVAI
jgi:hypothetical protein